MKKVNEVEELKAQWLKSPDWDLCDTEGFESYKYELREFQKKIEEEWKIKRLAKKAKEAKNLRDRLYSISLGEKFSFNGWTYTRVPGGWVMENSNGVVYVPYSQ